MAAWLTSVLENLPTALINGLVLGLVIALAAVGLTLIYGVLQIPSFAHGDMLTLGAYLGWALIAPAVAGWLGPSTALVTLLVMGVLLLRGELSRQGAWLLAGAAVLASLSWLTDLAGINVPVPAWELYSAIATAALLAAGLAVAGHYALFRPLKRRGAKMVMLMIASIGLAFFLRGVIQFIWGGDRRSYALELPTVISGPAGFSITSHQLIVLALAAAGALGIHLFLTRTTTGKMLRALADNPELALVTGIDVPRLTRFTWALGGALTGAAGVLYASIRPGLTPETGWILLLSIFAVVILGGIGSARGAILASLIIFMAQEVSVILTAPLDLPLLGPQYKVAVGFVILIVTLLVKPEGLMGVPVR